MHTEPFLLLTLKLTQRTRARLMLKGLTMLTILDRRRGLRPGLNFSLWKKKGPGPGPNRGHSLRRNHPSQRNQQLVRRRRRLTWKRRGPLLTPFSQKFQRILELRVWVSIAGQSGKSIGVGAGLLPGRPGPKTRLAERSSVVTLWLSSQRLVCRSRRNPTSRTRPRGNVHRHGWTSAWQKRLSGWWM